MLGFSGITMLVYMGLSEEVQQAAAEQKETKQEEAPQEEQQQGFKASP